MSARYGRAQGVALAGVAAVGLLVGGMVFVGSGGANAGVPVKPVLEGSAPQWADGYNHFILTMSGPVPLVADGSLTRGSATAKPAGGQRRAAGKADQAVGPPSGLGASGRSGLGAVRCRQCARCCHQRCPQPSGCARSPRCHEFPRCPQYWGSLSAGRHPLAGCDAELRLPQ